MLTSMDCPLNRRPHLLWLGHDLPVTESEHAEPQLVEDHVALSILLRVLCAVILEAVGLHHKPVADEGVDSPYASDEHLCAEAHLQGAKHDPQVTFNARLGARVNHGANPGAETPSEVEGIEYIVRLQDVLPKERVAHRHSIGWSKALDGAAEGNVRWVDSLEDGSGRAMQTVVDQMGRMWSRATESHMKAALSVRLPDTGEAQRLDATERTARCNCGNGCGVGARLRIPSASDATEPPAKKFLADACTLLCGERPERENASPCFK